ncbi:MAG: CRTAC1 family protein, partial [Bacteroidota bacterium]
MDFKGFAQQAIFFDYDLDGDLDLFLLTHSVHSAETYVKAEKRTERDSMAGDYLFRNEGGKFTDVSELAGIFGAKMGYGLAAVAADFNNNGCPDLYVANDFHENDYLYLNNCDGTFSESIASAMGHTSTFSMGVDAADINNDGWLDLMSLDMKPEIETIRKASAGDDHYNLQLMKLGFGYHHQFPRNMLQLNLGASRNVIFEKNDISTLAFAEIGQVAGVAATDWSWSTLLADFDNDGWKDIFITNGIWRRPNDLDYLKFTADEEVQRFASDLDLAAKMPSGAAPNYAFRNLGGAFPQFQNVSKDWGLDLTGCSNGAAYADFDNDGDLDLAVNNLNATASIFRNNSERVGNNHFLKVRLEGKDGNKFGFGARVTVRAGELVQTQELSPVKGWQSSVDLTLHFGLGKAEQVDVV